jgi:hypothetical protein
MSLFTSFSCVKCPNYGLFVIASETYYDPTEPRLDAAKCEGCGTER